jgi:hypothetical protein
MQVREQPDGVLPDGDRRPLHHRAGDRFVFLFSVSVCTRDLELSSDLVFYFLVQALVILRKWSSGGQFIRNALNF